MCRRRVDGNGVAAIARDASTIAAFLQVAGFGRNGLLILIWTAVSHHTRIGMMTYV